MTRIVTAPEHLPGALLDDMRCWMQHEAWLAGHLEHCARHEEGAGGSPVLAELYHRTAREAWGRAVGLRSALEYLKQESGPLRLLSAEARQHGLEGTSKEPAEPEGASVYVTVYWDQEGAA